MSGADPELGITDEDRERMRQMKARSDRHGLGVKLSQHGVDGDPVELALEVCPEDAAAAKKLVAAYIFENGAHTAPEVADVLGVSYPHAKNTLDELVEVGALRTSVRPQPGCGPNPTLYSPNPEVLDQ